VAPIESTADDDAIGANEKLPIMNEFRANGELNNTANKSAHEPQKRSKNTESDAGGGDGEDAVVELSDGDSFRLAVLLLLAALFADRVSLDDRLYISRRCGDFNSDSTANCFGTLRRIWRVIFGALAARLTTQFPSLLPSSSFDFATSFKAQYPTIFSNNICGRENVTSLMDPFDSTVLQLYCLLPTCVLLASIEELLSDESNAIRFPFSPLEQPPAGIERIRLTREACLKNLPVFRNILNSTLREATSAANESLALPESNFGSIRNEDKYHYHSLKLIREEESQYGGRMNDTTREFYNLKPNESSVSIDAEPADYNFNRTAKNLKIPMDIVLVIERLLADDVTLQVRTLARPVLMNHAEYCVTRIQEHLKSSPKNESQLLNNCLCFLLLYLWYECILVLYFYF
jgi:hypothetical protein